jgi:hypothetical protein
MKCVSGRWLSGAVSVIAGGAVATSILASLPVQPALAANEATIAEPVSLGGAVSIRRLNEEQYKRSIEDIFGTDIKVPGRFDPVLREDGLLAIGDSHVNVSASGLEQNELRARQIAAQVLAEDKRKTYLACQPASATAFDAGCASRFLGKYGRLIYRRPLTKAELTSVMSVASAAAAKTQSFYRGLEVGLARLLYSPNFIFRIERSEPDPARPGRQRLDGYSLASRISFLLWNAPPDPELLDAAADGTLQQQAVLERQVDRLMASPRFAAGVRALFGDMLGFNQFEGLSKDQTVFRKYTSQMASDAREQVLRTIVALLVDEKGDYRDLFTTKQTFLNRNLGALYEIPIEDGAGIEGWVPYTFGDADRRAGLLTFAGMLMLDPTHEGRSSPTNRGKFIREALMCQPVPAPPANVNFSIVQDTSSTVNRTARQRLTAHRENPVCAGCHAITDPIGLSMENYDAIGAYRLRENGALIDASGTFEGKPYKDTLDLSQILHDSPAIPACLVQRAYEYGVGRKPSASEEAWLDYANLAFARDDYRFAALIKRIATSKSFRAVSRGVVAAK